MSFFRTSTRSLQRFEFKMHSANTALSIIDRFHRDCEVLTESFFLVPFVTCSAFLATCRSSLVSLSHAGFVHVLVAVASERATHTAKRFMNF